ncbi:MAG: proline--tRNA ligase [Candidatus Accumulibacter sp.]|jgi:prolyl-tRNA synthetase|nr:proline--tRNA ligase [Accumulibacter sp.]
MRTSRYFISTLKEAPAEAEIASHRLMLRAGLVKRLAGGIYTWMPLGLRVLRKVEAIVREEMNRAGALEISMPGVQPAELWQESGRWEKYGPELLRFKDRHQRDFVLAPTHEEVVTDIVRRELRSYRQLPLHLYQIQTKFRDEIRPRFGVMRGREFLMKDGYSFHADYDDLQREYRNMFETYTRIFTRLGLKFRAVRADTGSIGGTGSHEFHVLADSGEDALAYCPDSDYAANVELAEALPPEARRAAPSLPLEKTPTPGKTRCEEVAAFLGIPVERMLKAVALVRRAPSAREDEFVLILLRGDHELNEVKTQKIIGEFRFARDGEIVAALGCRPGFIGPVGIGDVPVFADRSAAVLSDFCCGANEADHHLTGVNFGRDLPEPKAIADFRNVVAGDASPDGEGRLEICRGIEVGHIFQLRTKYAEALKCVYLDEESQTRPMEMGCYGIGVSRIVGAAIEQNSDERGIVFPASIAPFEVCIVPMAYAKNAKVRDAADALYARLKSAGFDVLLDDRDERPGVLFADMELIGIPHRVVVGDRGIHRNEFEYKGRVDAEASMIPADEIETFLKTRLCALPTPSSS